MSALVAREIWSVAGLLDAFLLGAVLVILLGSRIKAWAAVEKDAVTDMTKRIEHLEEAKASRGGHCSLFPSKRKLVRMAAANRRARLMLMAHARAPRRELRQKSSSAMQPPLEQSRDRWQRMGELVSTMRTFLQQQQQNAALRSGAPCEPKSQELSTNTASVSREAAWEQQQHLVNARALACVRSAVPIEISCLRVQDLKTMATPSGIAFPTRLAIRLQRIKALHLVREHPQHIAKFHPSVFANYNLYGLSLLERRALLLALQEPAHEWARQLAHHCNPMIEKKLSWYHQLRDALMRDVAAYERHASLMHQPMGPDICSKKRECPKQVEQDIEELYAAGLGFPGDASYCMPREVVKSHMMEA